MPLQQRRFIFPQKIRDMVSGPREVKLPHAAPDRSSRIERLSLHPAATPGTAQTPRHPPRFIRHPLQAVVL